MKFPNARLLFLVVGSVAGGLASAGAQASRPNPSIITPPAVKDGSNASRAPFPSARPFDDIKAPDGQAIDQNVPPNTPATNPDPFPPAPASVAILQPRAPAGEPALAMTGRPSVGLATSLDTNRVASSLRAESFATRDPLLADIETRLDTSDRAMKSFEESTHEMSADNRALFKTAAADVKTKEKAVRKSLRTARRASEQNWDAARMALATDFEAFAASAAQVDAAAGIPPAER